MSKIEMGVRQGYIFLLDLFNHYSEGVLKELEVLLGFFIGGQGAKLVGHQATTHIDHQNVSRMTFRPSCRTVTVGVIDSGMSELTRPNKNTEYSEATLANPPLNGL